MLLIAMLLSAGVLAGQDADPDCANPSGLLETVECYGQWRDRALAAQQAMLSRIDQALGMLSPKNGTEPAKARQFLTEAQASWGDFVEADCAAGEVLFGAGNAFALDALDCEITHIEARNQQLLSFEEKYIGT